MPHGMYSSTTAKQELTVKATTGNTNCQEKKCTLVPKMCFFLCKSEAKIKFKQQLNTLAIATAMSNCVLFYH